jgi:hypothetical protein
MDANNTTSILTTVTPATDTRGTCIRAKFGEPGWGGKTLSVAWDYSRTGNENHRIAAERLLAAHRYEVAGAHYRHVGSGQIGHAKQVHLFRLIYRTTSV